MKLILLNDDGTLVEEWFMTGDSISARNEIEQSNLELYGSERQYEREVANAANDA